MWVLLHTRQKKEAGQNKLDMPQYCCKMHIFSSPRVISKLVVVFMSSCIIMNDLRNSHGCTKYVTEQKRNWGQVLTIMFFLMAILILKIPVPPVLLLSLFISNLN